MEQLKKKHSRLFAVLMVFIMMLVMMPTQAFAATSFTYAINDVPSNGQSYGKITAGTISGTEGGVAEHSWDGTSLTVALTKDTPDNAVITSSWTKSGSFASNCTVSGAGDVTLKDGTGEQDVVLKFSTRQLSKLHVLYTKDAAPALAEGQSAKADGETTANETYTVDLKSVFADSDNDALTYQVKVDGGDYANIDGSSYDYKAAAAGNHTLVFRAYDGVRYSSDTYTVNAKVNNSKTTYDVNVTVPKDLSVKFYAVNEVKDNAAVKGEELTYKDGVVKVPDNLTRITWEADGVTGMSAPVSSGAKLELAKVKFNAKLDSGESDDAAAIVITDSDGVKISGTAADEYLLPAAEGFTYKATPSSSYSKTYNAAELTKQTPASGTVELTFVSKHFTVIAPKGSVVSAGTLSTYYIYSFKEPIKTKTDGDNVIYEFEPLSGNAFIRVQQPDDEDAVTYWNWASSKADGQTITVTEDMLFKNDSNAFDSDTVYHNFENKNTVDVADIYLNANEKGYINIETGGTFTFNVFRNWQAIEGISNAKTCLPDVKYTVIDEKGNESNAVTVTPDKNNSSVATLKANSKGTAIVLVTYDAVYTDSHMAGDGKYSAIWPENTGVLVVTVGADGSSIKTNMTINEGKNANTAISKLVGDTLDAEHDVLYYTGEAGANYSFTPEDGCKVSVARATLTKKSLTYSGFTTDKVDVDSKTGEVTVSGLTSGSHIIKVEKDGTAAYQVIRAKQTTGNITDSEGNAVTSETKVKPGTTLTIQLGDLYNPINKLSGIYNTNCRVYYKGEDGTEFRGNNGSNYGYYAFAFNTDLHKVTVTIPSDWDKATYTLSGCLQTGGFGDAAGRHRGATYATGKPVNTTANATAAYLGELPEITVKIDIPATAVSLDKTELALNCKDSAELKATATPENSTDAKTWTSSNEKVVTVDENGKVTAVGTGEATVTVKAGEFSAECKVTVAHKMTHHDAVAPTCTKDGNVEYYTCSACEKNFADKDGKTMLETVVDASKGHDTVKDSWESDDTYHWHKCSNCTEKLDTAKHSGGKATTTKKAVCEICGSEYGEYAAASDDGSGTGSDGSNTGNTDNTGNAGKTDSGQNQDTKDNAADSSKTGDNTMAGLFVILLTLSAAGAVGALVYKKRRFE